MKPVQNLDYDSSLCCNDCNLVALQKYVYVKTCKHIVCVFCLKAHDCRKT